MIHCRSKGLSLVELMIALSLNAVIFGGLFVILFHFVAFYDHMREKRIALQRCETVIALLMDPLTHCGYGMPLDASAYRSSFNVTSAPFNWAGPLSVAPLTAGSLTRKNAICRIAYAVPSGVRLRSSLSVEPHDFWINLGASPTHADPKLSVSYKPENWVLFGAMRPSNIFPLLVLNKADKSLFVRAPVGAAGGVLVEGDELGYFRVLEARAYGDTFYTNDYSGSGLQPRVDGIIDVRFDWDSAAKLITVSVLARGDARRGKNSENIPQNWPDAYRADLDADIFHYALEGRQFSLKMRNWR